MIRKAFLMAVHPDRHKEYQKRHNPIWPELEAALKTNGVNNYSIFLNAAMNQLFAYVEVESEKRWQAIAKTAICKKWWRHMKEIMPSNPDHSPVAIELKEVFHLD